MDAHHPWPSDSRSSGQRYTLDDGLLCVGRGWHPLVTRVFAVIEGAGGHVTQVKEKWAALRVDAVWEGARGTEKDQRATLRELDAIEEMSRHTCERCGARGWLVGHTWVKTLCPPHAVRYLAGEPITDWEQLGDANLS